MVVTFVSYPTASAAQTSVRKTLDAVGISTNKLTSGQRVFSAEEDAASLAVGKGLSVEISALQSAVLNTSTGLSMLQVAEGAMGDIQSLLERMEILAVQASSDNIGAPERAMLNTEFQALKDEVDRLAADTTFNDQNLLGGDAAYGVSYAHTIQVDGIRNPEFDSGIVDSDQAFRYTYDSATEVLTLTRIDGGGAASQNIDLTALLDSKAGVAQNLSAGETIEVTFSAVGVTLTLDEAFDRTADIQPTLTDNSGADITLTDGGTPLSFNTSGVTDEAVDALIALNGGVYSTATGELTIPIETDGAAVQLSAVSGLRYDVNSAGLTADNTASADMVGAGAVVDVYVVTASGQEQLGTLTFTSVATSGTTNGELVMNLGQGLFDADYTSSGGSQTFSFMVGSSTTAAEDFVDVTIPETTSSALGIGSSIITSSADASSAMDNLSTALITLSSNRAELGANQSRMEFVASQLSLVLENNLSARSTLLDVDVSVELTELQKNEVLSQVGLEMLGRLNQQPQRLLQLLQN